MRLLAMAGCVTMAIVSLLVRPLIPIDETRYVTVAWEMWDHGSFVVPLLNGSAYAHKPPMLFWLIHLGWAIFGVNEWWPRLIGPICTLVNLLLLERLANRLWPQYPIIRHLTPLIFVSTWFVSLYLTGLMFDMVLLTCVLVAWLTMLRAMDEDRGVGLLLFGIAIGFGLITKGPVVFVYTLPLALGAPWYGNVGNAGESSRWYLGLAAAIGIALIIPALWLAAAAYVGNEEYLRELLFNQTLDRVSGTLGHGRPFWWYWPILPVLLLPWIAWPVAWRGLYQLKNLSGDFGLRFVGIGIITMIVILSLIGGKQVHYLLPFLALGALALAKAIAIAPVSKGWSGAMIVVGATILAVTAVTVMVLRRAESAAMWFAHPAVWIPFLVALPLLVAAFQLRKPASVAAPAIALVGFSCVAVAMTSIFHFFGTQFDLAPMGRYLGERQAQGHALAVIGNYEGEFGFYGRLQQPVARVTLPCVATWASRNPDGFVVNAPGRQLLGQSDFRTHSVDGDWSVFRSAVISELSIPSSESMNTDKGPVVNVPCTWHGHEFSN